MTTSAPSTNTSTTNEHFNAQTEAKEVAAAFSESIKGRTILITGVNKQGIGYATAEAFATQSPKQLILTGRSQAKLDECKDALTTEYPFVAVRIVVADLTSLKSIRRAAGEILGWEDVSTIDLVINNAGIMRHGESGEMHLSEDGIEDQFATNHLGHYFLTNLIMPKIVAAAGKTSSPGSVRIINVSSSGTWVSPFRASDVAWKKHSSELPENEQPNWKMLEAAGVPTSGTDIYFPTVAYCQSKTCNVLFSVELNRRLYEKYRILSLSLNPGEIKSELGRNTLAEWLDAAIRRREAAGLLTWKSLGQGASTTLVAACDPKLTLPETDGHGYFLSDCQIAKSPTWAVDQRAAEKLWLVSESLTGQRFDP